MVLKLDLVLVLLLDRLLPPLLRHFRLVFTVGLEVSVYGELEVNPG